MEWKGLWTYVGQLIPGSSRGDSSDGEEEYKDAPKSGKHRRVRRRARLRARDVKEGVDELKVSGGPEGSSPPRSIYLVSQSDSDSDSEDLEEEEVQEVERNRRGERRKDKDSNNDDDGDGGDAEQDDDDDDEDRDMGDAASSSSSSSLTCQSEEEEEDADTEVEDNSANGSGKESGDRTEKQVETKKDVLVDAKNIDDNTHDAERGAEKTVGSSAEERIEKETYGQTDDRTGGGNATGRGGTSGHRCTNDSKRSTGQCGSEQARGDGSNGEETENGGKPSNRGGRAGTRQQENAKGEEPNYESGDDGVNEVKVAGKGEDERGRKADGIDYGREAGAEFSRDANLLTEQEVEKFDEKAEHDASCKKQQEGVSCCRNEDNRSEDVRGTAEHEASRAKTTRAKTNDDKTDKWEENTESERDGRGRGGGGRVKHNNNNTDKTKNKSKKNGRDEEQKYQQQQDSIGGKESYNNQGEEEEETHVNHVKKEPSENENEKVCGQPEPGPAVSEETKETRASADQGSYGYQMKGSESTRAKESVGDIVVDEVGAPKENDRTYSIVEEEEDERKLKKDETDKQTSITNNETNAALIKSTVVGFGKAHERIKYGQRRRLGGRKEVANGGTNYDDDDGNDLGVVESENKGKKPADGPDDEILAKRMTNDATERKAGETGYYETLSISDGAYGYRSTDAGNNDKGEAADNNLTYDTPEEEEEEIVVAVKGEGKHTVKDLNPLVDEIPKNESEQCGNNRGKEEVITPESEGNTKGETVITGDARTRDRGDKEKKRDSEKKIRRGEKDEEVEETMKEGEITIKTEDVEQQHPKTKINGSKDQIEEAGNFPGGPGRCDRPRKKRKQNLEKKVTGVKMGEEEEKEEEEKDMEEDEVERGISEVKKENKTESDNGEKGDNENGGDRGGGGGGGGSVGGGGEGRKRRRKRKYRGDSRKEMESEGEGDLPKQENTEPNTQDEIKRPREIARRGSDKEITNAKQTGTEAEEDKGYEKAESKKGNAEERRRAEQGNRADLMLKEGMNHEPEAYRAEYGGEKASLSCVRNTATKEEPRTGCREAGMDGALQFSDVAKQIMKEVQETRNRRNKCLRDLRSTKPKTTRIYMARKDMETRPETERETSNQAWLGEDISEGLRDTVNLKQLSPIPEVSVPRCFPARQKISLESDSPSVSIQEPGAFVFSSVEYYKSLQDSKAVLWSSERQQSAAKNTQLSLETSEGADNNRKQTNSLSAEEVETCRQLSVECSTSPSPESPEESRSSSSNTTDGTRKKLQTALGKKGAAVLTCTPEEEVTRRELMSLAIEPPLQLPPDGDIVNPSVVASSEPRQPDSDDMLAKNSPGTEAEATGGRADQCLVAAGRVRVCGCVASSVAAATASTTASTTTTTIIQPLSHRSLDASHGRAVKDNTAFASDIVDNNDITETGRAVKGKELLKEAENIPLKVVGLKHKIGVGPCVQLQTPCKEPRSVYDRICAAKSSATLNADGASNEHEQGAKKTDASKNGREVFVSGAVRKLANSLEVLDNTDNESKENGDGSSSSKPSEHSQGVIEVNREEEGRVRKSMNQDGSKGAPSIKAFTVPSSENGNEADAFEGPWATPQLARVVQELVVSRRFSMSSAQAKKRQQNLTRLDAQQKDRTLIFDSSRLIKDKDKNESSSQPQNEASKVTQSNDQTHNTESKSASKIIGRRNRRSIAKEDEAAQRDPTKKGKRPQRQEGNTVDLEVSRDVDVQTNTASLTGHHKDVSVPIKVNTSEKNTETETESVQAEGMNVNALQTAEEVSYEVDKAGFINIDDSSKLQSPPVIEQLSCSPQHPRVRMRKVVENLTFRHDQLSPRSSPQPGSPEFNSSLTSSPRLAENLSTSPPGVSPSLNSPGARTTQIVTHSPRFREPVLPSGVEVIDKSSASEITQKMSSRQQRQETRSPSSIAQRKTPEGKEDHQTGESSANLPLKKSKGDELSSPLRKTPTRSDVPTELIFNFVKLPQILTGHGSSSKKDQHPTSRESDPHTESSTGLIRTKERQGAECQPSVSSKPSAGKLDSDILQFFESQQHKPREIVRNETVIPEHFKGTTINVKLRSDIDRRLEREPKQDSVSAYRLKGSFPDNIEPGRRDRTSSDPMEEPARRHRNTQKLRSVKSFDDGSALRSSSSEGEKEENESPQGNSGKRMMRAEQSADKGKTSNGHRGQSMEESGGNGAGQESNLRTSVAITSNRRGVARTEITRLHPTHSARDGHLEEEEEERENKRNTVNVTLSDQNPKRHEGVNRISSQNDAKKTSERHASQGTERENSDTVSEDTAMNTEASDNRQGDVDVENLTDNPIVLRSETRTLKDTGLENVQADITHGTKKQDGLEGGGGDMADRRMRLMTNNTKVNKTSDLTLALNQERQRGERVFASVPHDVGVSPFMAVVQELQEKTGGRGGSRRKEEVGCEGELPLQDDRAGEVANLLFNKSPVLQVIPVPPPPPPPSVSSLRGHAPTSSPGSKILSPQDDEHKEGMSEGLMDASGTSELVLNNPERRDGTERVSRDSVTFHLTLVTTGNRKERDADKTPPESSPESIVIQKKVETTAAIESDRRTDTFLETCFDDIEPQQQQQQTKGSCFTTQRVLDNSRFTESDYFEGEKTEKNYEVVRLTEPNKTLDSNEVGREVEAGEGTEHGSTAASRRLPRNHRRLTKTISEGSFSLGHQEPDAGDPPKQNLAKLPRPPSLIRSRTESEFSSERLALAAAVQCGTATRTSTVSEIFARGVYGRLKAKSRSVENIRMSSLCCVEIPFPPEPPAPPTSVPNSTVYATSPSSSSCRIVGVLKKKHADDILDYKLAPGMDIKSVEGNGCTIVSDKAHHLSGESERIDSKEAPPDMTGGQSKLPISLPPLEVFQGDTTTCQQKREEQETVASGASDTGITGKSSLSEGSLAESPIYQNIPEALVHQKKMEERMAIPLLSQTQEEQQQRPCAGDSKKHCQKAIHIYENVPIVAGREPQDEPAVIESPKRIIQQIPDKSVSGNDASDSPSSSSCPSTSPLSDVFFPSKRTAFEKTSLKRKQQPESESRIEKQKSNYMKQRAVRVGILKKQKSDITGVRLQKLHYFDNELPGELRRSYSLSGSSAVENKVPRSDTNGVENDTGPDNPDTDLRQREGKEELNDLEHRCSSSISNTSRSSAIDRILQSCAPCISRNTSSTLDLSSSATPSSQSPQRKPGFYSGGDGIVGGAGRSHRHQHTRTKHPYRSSYSSSDVTLLSSAASSLSSQDSRADRQTGRAEQKDSIKPPDSAEREGQVSTDQETKTNAAESGQTKGSHYIGSTSGLASSETSSSIDEVTNSSKQRMNNTNFTSCDRDSCTPTPEQTGGPNSETDFYSELLDTILSVVDAQEQSFSGEAENLCSSEGAGSQCSEEQENQIHDSGDTKTKTETHTNCPNAATSDSDSTTSVDSELAEVRRRITERFPPVPRTNPEASQESVLLSPSAVCPMPGCAACRTTTNFSVPLMFAFEQPITPPALCEPERATSLPFVDHTFTSTNNDHFIRSTSLPHDPEIYHSPQIMCRHDQDEEEYWSAGEEARGTPQGTPRHRASLQGYLPQHVKHQSKPLLLRNELLSPEELLTKDSLQQDSLPLTDSGVEMTKDHSELTSNQLVEEVSQLRLENEKLSVRNRSLQSEVEELRRVKESMVDEDLTLKPKISEMTVELTHAKEALSALKADRKRLKAEKFDLLNQMKQLYATLEDKEKELRDFIRNYEQRMKDSDESLRHLAAERDETEREKWNILKHARDESEKVVKLSAQLGLKEATVKKLQEELDMVRKQLNSVGYYSDAESVRTNGLPTPTASTPTCSPLPIVTPTPTPNGRGSSADSGVRLSSDRESTASHDGGPGTPKESPSLSPLYATPAYCRAGEEHPGGGDKTPTSAQTPASMSGLANSSANTGGLSRSAEQLCERLSEGGELSKAQGTSTLMRKNHKSSGTWGSISRVFARQKKRAALDTSIYDGSGSDKRASWSPSSSLCASPLTEESYSEKLRLLEEAQHIPLERWKAPTVLAWLEVTLGMAQYGAMCAENVRSGKVLLELSDSELEAGLGITHPMHRKKLRLAIEELREPRLTRYPRISALGHTWVSSEWLPDLGLPQYSENFANSLVDGRLLEALTKKELEKHLGVHRKFHQASIIHGVHLLRIVRFDRQVLAERRRQCELADTDPVVWTNLRWVRWARSIDLAEYADNLKDSGVHGALVVLEPSFTSDTMATALGIPQSKNIIRRHLATELESLVNPARQQLDEQARYAKMERRRQEKLASGGSLGRSFSRSYGTGLEKGEKEKRRASLRPLQKQAFAFPTLPSKVQTTLEGLGSD